MPERQRRSKTSAVTISRTVKRRVHLPVSHGSVVHSDLFIVEKLATFDELATLGEWVIADRMMACLQRDEGQHPDL